MDYDSVNSGIMECLNLLVLPIKRLPIENKLFTENFLNPSNFEEELLPICAEDSQSKLTDTTNAESRVFLWNTSKLRDCNHLIEKNCTVKNKQLVKVTVTPKHNRPKRNKKSNTIKKTNSDCEYSIKAKNIYFIVTGKQKDKICNIKTTESADFSSEYSKKHHENEKISIEELSNIDSLLSSLNMNKKKKNNQKVSNEQKPLMNVTINPNYKQCNCANKEHKEEIGYLNNSGSRVRIYGRLGITNNEKLVMNCAAQINDTLIPTTYTTFESKSSGLLYRNSNSNLQITSSFSNTGCLNSECSKYKNKYNKSTKEVDVQVDNIPSNVNVIRPSRRTNRPSKESQGTQVDLFRIDQLNNMKFSKPNDKTVQCNCLSFKSILNAATHSPEPKETHNPLVVISVYPKEEASDLVQITQQSGREKSRSSSPSENLKENKKQIGGTRRNFNTSKISPKTSRSPSPTKKTKLQNANRNIQSGGSQLQGNTKTQKHSQQLNRRDRTELGKTFNSERSSIKSSHLRNKEKGFTGISYMSGVESKTKNEIKKALIDDYTKNITDNFDKIKNNPKHKLSNVKINIDSKNELYDVMFQRDKKLTDLKINKKLKDASTTQSKCYQEPKRKSCCRNPIYTSRRSATPKINSKDSLEINHRHESDENRKRSKNFEFRAPVKHFVGDSCEVPDPLEREKQIRDLLGLNWIHQPTTSRNAKVQTQACGDFNGNNKLRSCKQRDNNTQTGALAHEIHSKRIQNFLTAEYATQCEPEIEGNAVYQQVVLKRNIQVFLQLDRYRKQKPIMLTQKQYMTVKRIVQSTLSKRNSLHKPMNYKRSSVSVGHIKKQKRQIKVLNSGCDKNTQTELQSQTRLPRRNRNRLKLPINAGSAENLNKTERVQTVVLFNSKDLETERSGDEIKIISPRQAVSSLEVHYSISCMKNVSFSATNVDSLRSSNLLVKKDSIRTIFRGWKKSPTPNLGASAYSLDSDETGPGLTSVRDLMEPLKLKKEENKKPFLRRLMSCLVMRSKISEIKVSANPAPGPMEPSMDSYHISTSLGAMEMTSSMYDTSISFYSDHNVYQPNAKTKRSFLSSVRGFLTNRKS